MTATLEDQLDTIRQGAFVELSGTVIEVRGLAVRVADLPVPVGSTVTVKTGRAKGKGPSIEGEVIGFDRDQTLIMPYGSTSGIRRGDRVTAGQFSQFVRVGESLLGRVLDGLGNPLDGKPMPNDTVFRPLRPKPIDPMDRPLIDTPLATGVRAVDGLLSVGRGQRLGVFAAPGVGKSTLLGTMVRHTEADVSVIALVGERGREVRDFIENHLGEAGLARSVVVCATGDEAAPVRLRAALVANTIAEYFRDRGLNVLLIMDSITRFCQAQRQIGLAAGEPPATKGYPPSVFSLLPTLLERSGRTTKGSITGLYAVLVEGDDMNEPIADAARGILDGHVVLSRALAAKGHWPAIDVLESISRVCDEVIQSDQQAARRQVLRLVNAYRQVEDLLNIGAYPAGSNPEFDLAIACKPSIDQFLQQGKQEVKGIADFDKTRRQVVALTHQFAAARKQVERLTQRPVQQAPARR
ncbi:MAG: FliI/YscN family ATPase [Planctomycetes bacterium]|nr:FliI/YscN family ATPase [Planctomycetota bacterium]